MKSKIIIVGLVVLLLTGLSFAAYQSTNNKRGENPDSPRPITQNDVEVEPEIKIGPVLTAGQKEVKITRIVPSGEDVPTARQIVIQFNRPMVPIGRMERDPAEIPVTITPDLACQWRWINTSALACQLNDGDDLQEATRYSVVMDPGLLAEDGATMAQTHVHTFISQRPQIRYAWFSNWHGPGSPVIRATFNQSVSRSSVEKYLRFTYKGGSPDDDAQSIAVTVEPDEDDRELPRFIIAPGESYILDFGPGASEPQKSDDDPRNIGGGEARRVWLVSPKKVLPLDTNVDLVIKPGLESALGKQRGIEDRVAVNFDTFPAFKFLGVSCTRNNHQSILITKENTQDIGKCNPMQGASLSFSVPVQPSQIKANIVIDPDLAGGRTDYDPWENTSDHSKVRRPHRKGQAYNIWLPERLKAAEPYTVKSKAPVISFGEKLKSLFRKPKRVSDLEDVFGRYIDTPIDLAFATDHRPPNFELTHKTGVLEDDLDSDVPIYVTNLDEVNIDYKRLTKAGASDIRTFTVTEEAKVQDVQFAVPMRVRDMLDGNSGAIYGSVKTVPNVNKHPSERMLFAVVSPYQLHVKIGHYNTLVWVTDLKTGEPVADANVKIYKDRIIALSARPKSLGDGITDEFGRVQFKGTKDLDPELDLADWCEENNQDKCERLFIRVDKGDEMGLLPLERRFEINTYRVSNNAVWERTQKKYGHIHTWGTTAQGVYRAGGTIQYKFYVRDQSNDTYIAAPRRTYKLEIVDPTGKAAHEVKGITLSSFGSYDGEFTVPENAPVGWYQFRLSANYTDDYTWQPMHVLVSDFTPSPFKVSNSLNGDLFHPGDEVEVSSQASLHSGGAYTDAELRVTANLNRAYFSSKHPVANGFNFDSSWGSGTNRVFQKIDNIGDQGKAGHTFKIEDQNIVYGRLTVESAVRDDRGKYIAASSSAEYLGVDRLVGLKRTKWVYEQDKPARIQYIVVDPRGTPVLGTDVDIKIEHLETKSSKVKGAGNTYITNYIDEWHPAGTCSGRSTTEPVDCEFTPEKAGSYRMTATIKDTKGAAHITKISAWVVGKGRVIWHQPNDNSLQIIPEQTEYKIGDTARYLIKNPYPGAQALVSIERYGVLKSWVQTLEGSTPLIEFEVERDFMPGFYFSVTVVSPRVDAPMPEMGQIDLGKPAFKTGYIEVPVNDPYKQIDITVSTEEEVYKPRDRVKVSLHAEPKTKDTNEAIEIAVVVLDEAVLDLVQGGTDYFDPYEGFYKLDGLDLRNYSLLTRLIGRQKFEKKGANAGGDGGADISMRSLFKYVSYWNPSIKPDANGNAEISFDVPDNLTGWRVLAFAVTPTDRMGLGHGNFKVNRPTEVRPVMPNQITEGDKFMAGFSVMNRMDKARKINVELIASGNLIAGDGCRAANDNAQNTTDTVCSLSKTVELAPFKRETVYMPLSASNVSQSRDVRAGEIKFQARANDAIDGDGIEHSLIVGKRRSLETAANYASTTEDQATESLLFPQNIHPDVGEVSVVLSPSVIGNIDGAFRYMRDYSYSGWEAKLSKALMASHYQNLEAYLPDDLQWEESEILMQETLNLAANYQAPNGGMVYFIPSDRYVSPYLSAYTALAFNWAAESGYDVPKPVEAKLHAYLDRLLKKDVVPTFYSRGMSSSVRAVALAALSKHNKVKLSDLERFRKDVQYMDLFGQSHYLQAALNIEGADEIVEEVTNRILATSSQSGGKFSFNETLDDSYSRILATPLRANCAILSSFTIYGQKQGGSEIVGDVPFKLVRMITQSRENRDHWENTQENVFCMNSLVDYSRIYEKDQPTMDVSVSLDQEAFGQTRFNALTDDAVTHNRPITEDDPGAQRTVTVARSGIGRLYYATRMRYASTDDHADRLNAGIDIRKEYSVERDDEWVMLANPSEIKRGELVRVDIFVSLPTARNFVVVDDPIPGGLEPVNRDLATSSIVDVDKGKFKASGGSWWFQFDDWHHYNVSRWSFYHKELRHNAARFYSDYLPAGNYILSYTAQAIAEGEFVKMPVHAEEMYDPDVFGKGLPGSLNVGGGAAEQ
jgi:uncharacterized protein YfaS (alpha-2-macroglobulin family)